MKEATTYEIAELRAFALRLRVIAADAQDLKPDEARQLFNPMVIELILMAHKLESFNGK